MAALISVAMATYNGQVFIKQQLQTILKQTHLPAELVITDDILSDKKRVCRGIVQMVTFPLRVHGNSALLGYCTNFIGVFLICLKRNH